MKKFLIVTLLICLTFTLVAQQVQQQNKGGKKKMKTNWEAEYLQMEKKYNSTYGAYQTLTQEHERMRKENKTLKAEKLKLDKLRVENKKLNEENARLKAELNKHKKGGKIKELKKVQQN